MVSRVRNGAPSNLNCASRVWIDKAHKGRSLAGLPAAAALSLALIASAAMAEPAVSAVGSPSAAGPVLAQQATPCINGWRTIHLVQRRGDYYGGVVVRCNTG